jgi:hypothetical protein
VNLEIGNALSPTPGTPIYATNETVSSQTVQATVEATESPNAVFLTTETVSATSSSIPFSSDVPPGTPAVTLNPTSPATFSPIALLSPAATQAVAGTSIPLVAATATNILTIESGTAGATAPVTRVDVLLVYDQGQLDLINLTSSTLSVRTMTFIQDGTERQFEAQTWVANARSDSLLPQHCYQVYRASIYTFQPTPLGDCTFSHRAAFWASADAHVFWVAPSGSPGTPTTTPPATFSVLIDGQTVITCQVIAADSGANGGQASNECPFSLPG